MTRLRTLRDLANAYATLCAEGRVPAGNPAPGAEADLTADVLVEASSFSRKDDLGTRFASPLHWTVDNFSIPNGGDGVKQGLDNHPGNDCLMLGVWNDGGRNEDGDLTNARIYRTVTLQPGRYFFGARYQTTYNLTSHAYIFAADAPYSTANLPRRALAYYPINACPDHDTAVHGLYFDVPSEREVTLGWQADLRNGNAQQEVRVDEVYLYYYGDIDRTRVHALADTIDAHLAALPYDALTAESTHLTAATSVRMPRVCSVGSMCETATNSCDSILRPLLWRQAASYLRDRHHRDILQTMTCVPHRA